MGHPAFDLGYVRTGPRSRIPFVVLPGGPGLGSVVPQRAFRGWAASAGLDLIMIEHRGVGFSRRDRSGVPLPQSAMWVTDVVDDIASVLDHERAATAFIVGSSYGAYLTAVFGARHPGRVAGMLLDSALQSTGDLALERQMIRRLFWDADTPLARAVRRVAGQGADERVLLGVVRAAYELGGEELLLPLLERRLRARFSPTWRALAAYAERGKSISRIPYYYEFDIAGTIAMRELDYAAEPDGLPLDPALTYADIAERFPAFAGEPYNLGAEARRFNWPLVLLTGTRDVRTPSAIARRVATTASDAILVEIENGHSALDTHPMALLRVMRELAAGRQRRLPGLGPELDRLPRAGLAARLPALLVAGLRLEDALTGSRLGGKRQPRTWR